LWLVIGAGRCGLQLARSMRAAGVALAGIVVRSPRGAARARRALPEVPRIAGEGPFPEADAALLAVGDDALATCARAVAPRLGPGCRVVLHVSGLHPASALAPLAARGRALGALHPLTSFPSATGALVPLDGVLAAVDGDGAALRAARALARTLGMRARRVGPEARARYHAAAALAANLTHALVAAAREELVRCAFSPAEAAAALRPLLAGSTAAALTARGWEAMTGPLARGDAATVGDHLRALTPDTAAAYAAVARLAAGRLRAAGIVSENDGAKLLSALTGLDFSASVQPMTGLGSR
jgi:predicted short-subunit dehydrogenase-like oxidoreductase (DUF2520 family)